MSGEVRCNGITLKRNDFGSFGAFVQQDDFLLDAFTPEEHLTFAAKLRTTLGKEEIKIKVDEIIRRLGLNDCRHTKVGNQQ
jgi:ABC-type multidrug transport system ATPase subunit